jgi:hypothetical protein
VDMEVGPYVIKVSLTPPVKGKPVTYVFRRSGTENVTIDDALALFAEMYRRSADNRDLAVEADKYYTKDAPPSGPADTSQQGRMRNDFDFDIAVKEARTETLARLVDLGNPALSPAERLRRARRLVRSYQRRKADNPEFQTSPEVREAFSIINRDAYQRQKAKAARSAKLAI